MKGSLTIEASFIYPILLIFIFFTILYNFYAHDKVAAKANAYSDMIHYYYEEKEYDKTNFINSLDNFCFLSDNYTCSYNKNTHKLCLQDKYGQFFNVPFSSYERCEFIREYYCLIKKIIAENLGKE